MRRRRARSVAAITALSLLSAAAAPAGAGLEFPSMAERVLGARTVARPACADGAPAAMRVECGDTELFGIAGLRASGVRALAARGPVFAGAEYVQVSSGVGVHARAVVEAGAAVAGAWQGAARAGVERLALDGFPAHRVAVAGLFNRVDVGPMAALADVTVEHRTRRASLSLALLARAGPAELAAHLRIEDGRRAGAGMGVAAHLHPRLALLAGFDDATRTVRAAVLVSWRSLEVGVGAFAHDVLGGSQGVSVAWAR